MTSVKKFYSTMFPPFVLCMIVSTVLAAQNTFTLYGYGTNISGSQVFYSQGPYSYSLQKVILY
jgi:hypothetical protein